MVNITGFKLSPQQKHLWSLIQGNGQQFAPIQGVFELEGTLDIPRLREALIQVVNRNEILRTRFPVLPGLSSALQIVEALLPPSITEHDWSRLDEQAQAQEQQTLLQISSEAIDVQQGPVIDVRIVAITRTYHLLIITMAALCADSTTLKLLGGEISQAYADGSKYQDSTNEIVQFPDVAEWQNQSLATIDKLRANAFYQRYDLPSLFDTHLSISRVEKHARLQEHRQIEPDKVQALLALADRFGSSLHDLLFTCWSVFLWRLTAHEHLLVGIPYNERQYSELEAALGPLTRKIPVISTFSPMMTIPEAIQTCAAHLHEANENQELFDRDYLADKAPDWQPNTHWPFGFTFASASEVVQFLGITMRMQKIAAFPDPAQLELMCVEDGHTIRLEYTSHNLVFDNISLADLAEQFVVMLTSVIQQPEQILDRLDVLTARDRERILVQWNQTVADIPSHHCIHHLFEQQVQRTPEATAMEYGGQEFSFATLNTRANQLAHYLRRQGAGAETIVGLSVERSPELLVSILGILKAGAAYVPLDPSYPKERLAFMIADMGVSILVTQQVLKEFLPQEAKQFICLDADAAAIARESTENPLVQITPDNLAYVIYTSGSTGKPKGVMVTHRGVVNYLTWASREYNVAAGNGTLVHSPLGFDLTVTSIFTPLLAGNIAHLLPEEGGLDAFVHVVRRQRDFSLLKLTPSHGELLNQVLQPAEMAAVARVMIFGGEELRTQTLIPWRIAAPSIRLINEYGPTETIVGSAFYEVSTSEPLYGSVPIGRPIANTQIYVLDRWMQPVYPGTPGDLYIGGAGVARGYWQRPDLTAERFVPHPFSTSSGDRLYKTGDIAQYRPDGTLEYLGRSDQQVKIRGYRIELAEIEAMLCQHPAIKTCAVVTHEEQPGEKILVAYLIPTQQQLPSHEELRAFLQTSLPDYMLPVAFVALEQLPLTAHGKLDRRALPQPEKHIHANNYIAPRTPLEKLLANLWAQALQVEQVGACDNFFTLGGHSLLITQILSRLRSQLRIEVPLHSFFETPTVEGMAQTVVHLLQIYVEQLNDEEAQQLLLIIGGDSNED